MDCRVMPGNDNEWICAGCYGAGVAAGAAGAEPALEPPRVVGLATMVQRGLQLSVAIAVVPRWMVTWRLVSGATTIS